MWIHFYTRNKKFFLDLYSVQRRNKRQFLCESELQRLEISDNTDKIPGGGVGDKRSDKHRQTLSHTHFVQLQYQFVICVCVWPWAGSDRKSDKGEFTDKLVTLPESTQIFLSVIKD